MKTNEETLQLALEAFWAKVQELHPERETNHWPAPQVYDLEIHARNAVDDWLDMNKPVFYVQRTAVQVVRITGAATPEQAEEEAADIDDTDWFDKSLNTSYEYLVVNRNGKAQ